MTATSRLTLDQYLVMEDTEPSSEYVCGEAIQKPMPDRPHSAIQRYLIVALVQFLERTKLGQVFPEFRCIFGPTGGERALVPDISYVAKEHLTADRYLRAAPDLAIEILSPGTRRASWTSSTSTCSTACAWSG